jgi:phosphoenolpyruvate carboxylase
VGALPPTEEQRKEFGFCDINSALVNTMEAIQNAPNKQKMKTKVENEDINDLKLVLKTELKRELKEELTTDLKEALANQREDIIIAANIYAQRLNSNLQEVVRKQMAEFSKIISMILTGEDEETGPLALPSSSNNPPNMCRKTTPHQNLLT